MTQILRAYFLLSLDTWLKTSGYNLSTVHAKRDKRAPRKVLPVVGLSNKKLQHSLQRANELSNRVASLFGMQVWDSSHKYWKKPTCG